MTSNYSGSKCFVDNTTVVDRRGTYNANSCDWEIEEVTYLPLHPGELPRHARRKP